MSGRLFFLDCKQTLLIMKKLTDLEIKNKIGSLQDWDFYEDALHTDFEFDNFKD